MKLRHLSNNSGIIMIIVLIILMVMAIFSVSIFSQSMSQTKSSRAQVDDIIAEEVAKGAFYLAYDEGTKSNNLAFPNKVLTEVINGRTFRAVVSKPANSTSVTVDVTY